MADRPVHPVGARESGVAEPASAAAVEDPLIFAHRIGCVLHILHIAVTAGMTNPFFMGPLGKGSWLEWEGDHLVALLGCVWYNISPSTACNTTFRQFQHLVQEHFPGEQCQRSSSGRLRPDGW